MYRRVECPHCGNDIVVNSNKKEMKCCWCRRLVGVKFTGKGKKSMCNVEALEFPEPYSEKTNYKKWKDKDIYG